jgi:hypothetical protein
MSTFGESIYQGVLHGSCAVVSASVKDLTFYGFDSYKLMQQSGAVDPKLSRLYRGCIPVAVLGSGLSFGAFFIFYNPVRNGVNQFFGPGYEHVSVLVASSVSSVPSSLVGVPADAVKKQLILKLDAGNPPKSALQMFLSLYKEGRWQRLFLGWRVNVIKDVPYASLKMSLYEGIARFYIYMRSNMHESCSRAKHNVVVNNVNGVQRQKAVPVVADSLSGKEAAGVGFASGVLAATITCPIDCINTRIKSGELAHLNVLEAGREMMAKAGGSVAPLFRGVALRAAVLSLGSTVFWYVQNSLIHRLEDR